MTMNRIRCKVCGRVEEGQTPALLCALCLENLDRTAAHIRTCLEAVWARWDAACEAWQATLAASPAANRWPAVENAMIGVGLGQVNADAFASLWIRRKAEGGDFAALLSAWEHHKAALDAMSQELARWNKARDEVNRAVLDLPLTHQEAA